MFLSKIILVKTFLSHIWTKITHKVQQTCGSCTGNRFSKLGPSLPMGRRQVPDPENRAIDAVEPRDRDSPSETTLRYCREKRPGRRSAHRAPQVVRQSLQKASTRSKDSFQFLGGEEKSSIHLSPRGKLHIGYIS